MSIFGKVLIFFNLLAAGAFAYFTLENWKLRQELTWANVRGEVVLRGIPLEAPANAPKVAGDEVAFPFRVNDIDIQTIPKKKHSDIVPPGDSAFGGDVVATQTAEVERLKTKVLSALPNISVNGGADRIRELQKLLLNLARTGAERDGINSLFSYADPFRRNYGRRDLPFLARTSSQVEALKAMADVGELGIEGGDRPTKIKNARESLKRFVLGELPHGASANDADELKRAINNAFATPNDATRQQVEGAAKADPAGFKHIAELAVNSLEGQADPAGAQKSLLSYVLSKAVAATPSEAKSLTAVADLISPPAAGFNALASIDSAGTDLLTQKFEEAAAPLSKGEAHEGKARKIAHLLYHIDADRHTIAAEATARQAWHTRVAWIVGLREYVRTAEAQASEYDDATQRLRAGIAAEEAAFKDQYQLLVQKSVNLHSQLQELEGKLKAQTAITAENKRLFEERQTERDKLVMELAESRESAKKTLDKLRETQKRHFDIQKQYRDAQEAIFALEVELRQRELAISKKDGGNSGGR